MHVRELVIHAIMLLKTEIEFVLCAMSSLKEWIVMS